MPDRSRASIHRLGRWEVDLARHELRASGVRVPLGSKAFDLIEVLIEAPGTLIAKDELVRRVWPNQGVDDNALQVHMSAIRKAFGEDRGLIETASGRGYRLLGAWLTAPEVAGLDAAAVPAGATAPPDNLPVAVTDLIEREVARQQVADLLSAHRVVTLVGSGGIGKTRLAVTVANDLRSTFSDGVWFADLSPLSDATLVPSVVAGALGLDLGSGAMAPEPVARAISDRRCLIVLDNCEHVIDAAARTAETIARTCPAVSILATSREPLRIDAEGVYRVLPLSFPADDQATCAELRQQGAVRLFVARAGSLNFASADQPAELQVVAAICRHLDGIPLAIELAAASASTLGLAETARHLDDRFHLLVGGRRTAPPRQRTLLATLDWSHELLSEIEQRILRRLGVFAGSFTLDAACAVATTPDMSRREIVEGVAGLATKSLLTVEVIGATTRYALLETVRAYELDKLATSGETEPVMRRHAQFYTELLRQAQADWENRAVADWIALYRRDLDNVRTALDWAFSVHGDARLAVQLTTNAIPQMFDLSVIAECQRYAERALQIVKAGAQPDPHSEMYLMSALQATRVYTEGPSAAALAAWEAVLQLATIHDDIDCKIRALWGLWNDNVYRGAPVAALAFARRFMDAAVALGDATKTLLGHRLIGTAQHYQGDQSASRVHLTQVVEHYVRDVHRLQTIGSRLDHATVTRATLARVLWLQGEPDGALRLNDIALADAVADDHLMSILYVLVEAAIPVSLAVRDHAATERFVGILVERATRSGFSIWQTYGRCFREVLRVRQPDHEADLRDLLAAIRELRAIGFCAHLPLFLGALAIGQANAGQAAEGLITVNEALGWSEIHQAHWYVPELLRIKARVILSEPSAMADVEAEALFRQALVLARRQGALSWELRAATSLARLLLRQGHTDQAGTILVPVFESFNEGFGTGDLIAAKRLLAELDC